MKTMKATITIELSTDSDSYVLHDRMYQVLFKAWTSAKHEAIEACKEGQDLLGRLDYGPADVAVKHNIHNEMIRK